MFELALFAGGGGGLLASELLGWFTMAAVEIEKKRRQILYARQRDKTLSKFPIWEDVKTFDGKPWRGLIDIITGGFPCQDVSAAGKGVGVGAGERSGLWKEYARIIDEIGPTFVFAENSPMLDRRGLKLILQDLSRMGYNVRWGVLGARQVGGQHERARMWILAYSSKQRRKKESALPRGNNIEKQIQDAAKKHFGEIYQSFLRGDVSDSVSRRRAEDDSKEFRKHKSRGIQKQPALQGGKGLFKEEPESRTLSNSFEVRKYAVENASGKNIRIYPKRSRDIPRLHSSQKDRLLANSLIARKPDDVAPWVDRFEAIGNGQVPRVAAIAFLILSKGWLHKTDNIR